MTRFTSKTVLAAAVLLGSVAFGQTSTFKVSTDQPGAIFYVDGYEYRAPVTFNWEKGTKHTLRFLVNVPPDTQLQELSGVRYTFGGWADDRGLLTTGADPVQVITADPSIKEFRASANVEYRVHLLIADAPPAANVNCGSPGPIVDGSTRPGVVYLNGTCYLASTTFWTAPTTFTLNAFPYPGYVFEGWSVNLGPTDAFLRTVEVKSQLSIVARFAPGKRVKFITSPMGRDLLINGTRTPTPESLQCGIDQLQPPVVLLPGNQSTLCIGEFDLAAGSRNILSAPSPQTDINGKLWVFDRWSIGGGQGTVYIANPVNVPQQITGFFIPGVRVSFVTTPTPLKLRIDGTEQSNLNFVWGVGKKYSVSAPAEQFDSRGRKYVFKGWSNGSTAPVQEITVPENPGTDGVRLTANYELLNRAVLGSTLPGMVFTVDGAECIAPCTVDRPAGTRASVSVPSTIPVSDMQRYDFATWQDGTTTAARNINFNVDSQTQNANFTIANKLLIFADPATAGTFSVSPESSDGFYASGSRVFVNAQANPGYRFRRFDGDLGGSAGDGFVTMSSPRVLRALFDEVPFIPPGAVRNAAGDTPVPGVAAGSLISIFGQRLAKGFEVGPSSPLSQTLNGTIVLVNDRILPLIYVSPEQINAQLPYDLPPGTYNLTVKTQGSTDVTGTFDIVRNAPGIFVYNVADQYFAFALHEDGTQITPQSPARRNETITVLGTGFGPFARRVLEGFATPETPVADVADAVEVGLGTARIAPTSVVAQPGMVGVVATKFRLSNDVPRGATLDLQISVNGAASNKLLLPVE